DNIITALMIAAQFPIPEVCLYFHNRLLRGCRAVKVDADGLEAFDSPNYPPLGLAGTDIVIDWSHVLSPAEVETPLQVLGPGTPSVGALRLFPGISAEVLRNVLRPPLQGLILEAYGVGNGPDRNRDFLTALREATDRGVVIVACSQCLRGTVSLEDYATGSALAAAGVISGMDMTPEAALAKMFCLFQEGYSVEEVKALLQQDLRGELTPSPTI
ncbi:MAG TPA: asparaginase domain-containing protein, partial [Chthonomonadaceae bacterium]|nr:asparaginase domain-containing protein [Chthonomonadaceae bacterium]